MVIISRWYQSKSKKQRIYIYVRYFLLWFATVLICNLLYSFRASNPKTRSMIVENERMVQRIEDMASRVDGLNEQLSVLNRRDSGTYRMVFGLDKHQMMNYPIENIEIEDKFFNDRYSNFIEDTWKKIAKTKIDVYNSSVAFDTIASIALQHVSVTRSIPAIWPIDIKRFKGSLCHFGWRMHPILKRRIFHEGLDLSCAPNTSVIAPADGVVRYVRGGWNGGFGNEIVINHGMGYQTRFAHLNKALVKVGDRVRRGDKIALSGSTGRSTGPHLHYEVIYQNKNVNPLNYFRRDQSKEDFSRMLETAREQNFENGENNMDNQTLPKSDKKKSKR